MRLLFRNQLGGLAPQGRLQPVTDATISKPTRSLEPQDGLQPAPWATVSNALRNLVVQDRFQLAPTVDASKPPRRAGQRSKAEPQNGESRKSSTLGTAHPGRERLAWRGPT